VSSDIGKRLPRGVPEQRILEALGLAKRDGITELSLAELQGQTELSIATLYDALRRLANSGGVRSSKVISDTSGRTELRISLPD